MKEISLQKSAQKSKPIVTLLNALRRRAGYLD